jgi:DNA-binding XRE family transcriptional regulator
VNRTLTGLDPSVTQALDRSERSAMIPRCSFGDFVQCLPYLTFVDRMSDIADITTMSTSTLPLPARQALRQLGRDLAVARRKRAISTADMAARLFISRDTLWRLERGDPTVSLGTLATATFVLRLHDRLAELAAPARDELALSLDERRLPQRIHRKRP